LNIRGGTLYKTQGVKSRIKTRREKSEREEEQYL
jgi:hypothetical protein